MLDSKEGMKEAAKGFKEVLEEDSEGAVSSVVVADIVPSAEFVAGWFSRWTN